MEWSKVSCDKWMLYLILQRQHDTTETMNIKTNYNMKAKAFLLAMAVTAVLPMTGQTTIKGFVADKSSGEGEPFATVRIYGNSNKEKAVDMFLTDVEGHFQHEVNAKGNFNVVVSSIGKDDVRKSVVLGEKKVLSLDTLWMTPNAKTLQGVEVVAQKPLVKMEVDKMTYNVAEDTDAPASTVLDMLRKVPMVNVDGQDNITVNGSQSFKVYVDGKPNVMFSSNPSIVLKNMPASAVKNIEVITNPGAKYDAEGAGGVLNIIMNRQDPQAMQSLNGVTGTVRAQVGNRNLGGGLFLNGQQGKLSYSANAMASKMNPGSTSLESTQKNGTGEVITRSKTDVNLPFVMGSFSMGYDLDPMSTVSTTLSLTRFNMKNEGLMSSVMTGEMYGGGYDYSYNLMQKNARTAFSGSADYQRFFNKERTSWLALTYQLNYNPSKTEMNNDFDKVSTDFVDLTDRSSENVEKTTDHTFQADYTTPVATGQTLSTGLKLMMRQAESDADYYLGGIFNADQSLDYLFKNTIAAAYAEYEAKFGKFGAKGGLRYEYTWQNVEYKEGHGQNFTKNYGNLVPTASLSYMLGMGSNIGLTYNMRISRPGITYLNPYVDRSNPTSISYGNTNIDVEQTHQLALVYNLFTSKLMMNLNLHHNFTDNGIEQYSFYDGSLLNTTYANTVSRHITGFNAYANWLATKNTRLFFNGGIDYTTMNSSALNTDNKGWHANAMVGVQQTLPWDLKIGAYLIAQSNTKTLQGWTSGFNLGTANISKSFLDDRLTFSLSGTAGLSKNGNIIIESKSEGNGFSNHQKIEVPMANVSLSISYTFGNTKRQTKMYSNRVKSDYIEQQSQGEIINNLGSGENIMTK